MAKVVTVERVLFDVLTREDITHEQAVAFAQKRVVEARPGDYTYREGRVFDTYMEKEFTVHPIQICVLGSEEII